MKNEFNICVEIDYIKKCGLNLYIKTSLTLFLYHIFFFTDHFIIIISFCLQIVTASLDLLFSLNIPIKNIKNNITELHKCS